MTNEEAINFGEMFLEVNVDSKNSSTYKFIDKAVKLFKQQPKWIPVSERLPEKDGGYLAYIVNPSDEKARYIMTCEYFVSHPGSLRSVWCPDNECASDNVVAWMPLPEEYKEE